MQLNRETNPAKYQIKKYSATSITVNEQEFTESIMVMPQLIAAWPVQNIRDLKTADLQVLLDLSPELILLGTGVDLVFPDPAVTQVLFKHKIGLEVMTTPAACRTYAALTSEGRNVLAALVISPV